MAQPNMVDMGVFAERTKACDTRLASLEETQRILTLKLEDSQKVFAIKIDEVNKELTTMKIEQAKATAKLGVLLAVVVGAASILTTIVTQYLVKLIDKI